MVKLSRTEGGVADALNNLDATRPDVRSKTKRQKRSNLLKVQEEHVAAEIVRGNATAVGGRCGETEMSTGATKKGRRKGKKSSNTDSKSAGTPAVTCDADAKDTQRTHLSQDSSRRRKKRRKSLKKDITPGQAAAEVHA